MHQLETGICINLLTDESYTVLVHIGACQRLVLEINDTMGIPEKIALSQIGTSVLEYG